MNTNSLMIFQRLIRTEFEPLNKDFLPPEPSFYRETLFEIQRETACMLEEIRKAKPQALWDEDVQGKLISAFSWGSHLVDDVRRVIGEVEILKPITTDDPSWENLYLSVFFALTEILDNIRLVYPLAVDFPAQKALSRLDHYKVYMNLSVPQIGCLLRLSYDAGIIQNKNKMEVFHIVSAFFSSTRAEHISVRSLRNAYYSQDVAVLGSVRTILTSLLNEVRRNLSVVLIFASVS